MIVRWSEKERRIIDLVAKGLKNKEIASIIGMSEQVLKNKLISIFAKAEVKKRTELIVKYYEGRIPCLATLNVLAS